MEDRSTFTQRIARIQKERGLPMPQAPDLSQMPRPDLRSETMLRGRVRGAVYLFAGFCAGLVVMAVVAGAAAPNMLTIAAL